MKLVQSEIAALEATINDPAGTVGDALAFLSDNSADRDGGVSREEFSVFVQKYLFQAIGQNLRREGTR